MEEGSKQQANLAICEIYGQWAVLHSAEMLDREKTQAILKGINNIYCSLFQHLQQCLPSVAWI